MKYNFYCHSCKTYFRKTAKLKMIDTEYGRREGIKCPLCKGKAEAKGIYTTIGTTNGEFSSVSGRDKVLDLD